MKRFMTRSDDHARYDYRRAPERAPRPPWTVRIVVNEGHAGSVLNCPHPACVAGRPARVGASPAPSDPEDR